MCAAVFFRLKSEKETCTVPIDGQEISVRLLRERIADIKKLKEDPALKKKGPNQTFYLTLIDNKTNEEYKDDTLIPAGTEVIVKRGLPCLPNRIGASNIEQTSSREPTRRRAEESITEQIAKIILTSSFIGELTCYVCKKHLKNPQLSTCCGLTSCFDCVPEVCEKCGKQNAVVPDKQLNLFLENVDIALRELMSQSNAINELINDASFYLVQVYSPESIEQSVLSSEWHIPSEYVTMLKTAFKEEKAIVFLFTDSKTRVFHGCALMMSNIIHLSDSNQNFANVKWLRHAIISFEDLEALSHPPQPHALTQPVERILSKSGIELCLLIDKAEQIELPEYKPINIAISDLPVKQEETEVQSKPIKPETSRKKRRRSRSPRKRSPSPRGKLRR